MTDEWRKIPERERPYDAYRKARYLVPGCDHNGPYCKCDPPLWLRPPSPTEERRFTAVRSDDEDREP